MDSTDGGPTRPAATVRKSLDQQEEYRVRDTDREPEDAPCCACRWIEGWGDCGHPESDGITSPHAHCERHRGDA